jgi:hypothetical protein
LGILIQPGSRRISGKQNLVIDYASDSSENRGLNIKFLRHFA